VSALLGVPPGARIFIASQPADLRKSFDGLCALVREALRADPMSGDLFVFRGKSARRVRILAWDRTGFAVWSKRLESGAFRFPVGSGATVEVEAAQLRLLLDGIRLGPRTQRKVADA
jgi:transposase